MTDRSTWIAEKRQLDRLRTPEGQAQDCLERSLPAVVLREAQADPLWNTQPETVTKVTLYASRLQQSGDQRRAVLRQSSGGLPRLHPRPAAVRFPHRRCQWGGEPCLLARDGRDRPLSS